MPVGTISYQKSLYAAVKLLEAQAVANSPPTLATQGADISSVYVTRIAIREGSLVIKGTGTGVVAGTFRIWGYCPEVADWIPLGVGTDGDKGKLNEGNSIGESATDKVLHAEPIDFPGHFTRLYLELSAPSGTSPSFDAYFIAPRNITY